VAKQIEVTKVGESTRIVGATDLLVTLRYPDGGMFTQGMVQARNNAGAVDVFADELLDRVEDAGRDLGITALQVIEAIRAAIGG
jgi:hypothetical protein